MAFDGKGGKSQTVRIRGPRTRVVEGEKKKQRSIYSCVGLGLLGGCGGGLEISTFLGVIEAVIRRARNK